MDLHRQAPCRRSLILQTFPRLLRGTNSFSFLCFSNVVAGSLAPNLIPWCLRVDVVRVIASICSLFCYKSFHILSQWRFSSIRPCEIFKDLCGVLKSLNYGKAFLYNNGGVAKSWSGVIKVFFSLLSDMLYSIMRWPYLHWSPCVSSCPVAVFFSNLHSEFPNVGVWAVEVNFLSTGPLDGIEKSKGTVPWSQDDTAREVPKERGC